MIDIVDSQHILISDLAKNEMIRLIKNVPSMAFMISITIFSFGKLSNAGGYSYSLWGAGFNIPGNPMCAWKPELCFPDYPGQGKRNAMCALKPELCFPGRGNKCYAHTWYAKIFERRLCT